MLLLLLACTEPVDPWTLDASAEGTTLVLESNTPPPVVSFSITLDPALAAEIDPEDAAEAAPDIDDLTFTFSLETTMEATEGIGSATEVLFWSDEDGPVPPAVEVFAPALETASFTLPAPVYTCDMIAGCTAGFTASFIKLETGEVTLSWGIRVEATVGEQAAQWLGDSTALSVEVGG